MYGKIRCCLIEIFNAKITFCAFFFELTSSDISLMPLQLNNVNSCICNFKLSRVVQVWYMKKQCYQLLVATVQHVIRSVSTETEGFR